MLFSRARHESFRIGQGQQKANTCTTVLFSVLPQLILRLLVQIQGLRKLLRSFFLVSRNVLSHQIVTMSVQVQSRPMIFPELPNLRRIESKDSQVQTSAWCLLRASICLWVKSMRCVLLHQTTLHYSTLRFVTLRYAILRCTALGLLHYITFHYITVPSVHHIIWQWYYNAVQRTTVHHNAGQYNTA